MKIPKSILLVAVGIIVGAILTAGTTVAVEAGASGTSPSVPTWYGCLSSKGALTKVGSVAPTCTGKTTAMSWNNYPSNGSGSPKCTGAFRDADLAGCNFSGDNLVNVDMTDSDLNAANLSYTTWDTPGANQANFTGADLVVANFAGAATGNGSTANFTDANLTGATFGGNAEANLDASTWYNTVCPDGTNSNNDGDTCVNNLTPAG